MLLLIAFLLMLIWTLDKFVRPERATGVYESLFE